MKIIFRPQVGLKKLTKSDVYACINYEMFDEVKQEFADSLKKFKKDMKMKLEPIDQGDNNEYEEEFEFPYGKIDCELKTAPKKKKDDEDL